MTRTALVLALAAGAASLGITAARADCESDMIQLETALKAPKLTPDAKAALDDARVKSVAAMKKDDDATCHKVIADALPKAGMTLK
jgi:hypothetical protein